MSSNASVFPSQVDRAPASESKERLRLWLRILKLSTIIEGELRERLRTEFSTTLPRFDVLAALYRDEQGLRMSELSKVLRVSNGNVTMIIDRLVDDGHVERVPVKNDRRAMVVRLTEQGREHFLEMAVEHEQWVDEMLGGLQGSEIAELRKLLDDALTGVETARESNAK